MKESDSTQSNLCVYLCVQDGSSVLFEKTFDKVPILIGRSLDCDVCLPQYNWVSRRHIHIYQENGHIFVTKLNPSNDFTLDSDVQDKVQVDGQLDFAIGSLNFKLSVPNFKDEKKSLVHFNWRKNRHFLPAQRKVIEAIVTWKDVIYDTRLYQPGETISLGSGKRDLYVPTLKGSYDISLGKLRLTSEIQSMDLGHNMTLHLRHAPAPRQLSKHIMGEPDELIKKCVIGSSFVHAFLLAMILIFAPRSEVPPVRDLPPRVAKLLVPPPSPPEPPKKKEPPKPPPQKAKTPPPPPTKPVQPQVVRNKPRPPQPKRVVVRPNENMKRINRLPTPPRPTPSPTVSAQQKSVNEVGALAALGALGQPTPTRQPVSINVNPQAGGATSASLAGVAGAIQAQGGRLQAASSPGVRTQGQGYGSGTGYGVQGVQGRAGARGVAGAVVGSPRLMEVQRTEGLTQQQVMEVVKRHVGHIQQCYERALLSSPGLAGRVEYEWFITPQGTVRSVTVKRSEMRNADALNGCVTQVFRDMKFPVARNGEATVPSIGFPFGQL